MSFKDEISFGFEAAHDFAGEGFTLSNYPGTFSGVFRGDLAEVGFDGLQGHNSEVTNEVSVGKSLFTFGDPRVDQILFKEDGTKYNVTAVDSSDGVTWDITLKRIDD